MSAYILSNALVYLKDILPITAGVGATFRISPDLERGLDINTGGVNAFFILKSSTQIERYLITAVGGVATIVKRGLEQDGITENANLKKSWGDGSVGYITVKPDDFIALGKLDTAGGLRNTMGTAQNIGATNGSPNITVADTTGWANGATITGTGIPGGTTIVSFVPNTSAVLSANFTGTTGTVSVVVGKRMTLEIDSSNNEVKKVISNGVSILSTESIRKRKSDGTYEEIEWSNILSSLQSTFGKVSTEYVRTTTMGEAILSAGYGPNITKNSALNGPTGGTFSVMGGRVRFPVRTKIISVSWKTNAINTLGAMIIQSDAGVVLSTTPIANGTKIASGINYVCEPGVYYQIGVNSTANFGGYGDFTITPAYIEEGFVTGCYNNGNFDTNWRLEQLVYQRETPNMVAVSIVDRVYHNQGTFVSSAVGNGARMGVRFLVPTACKLWEVRSYIPATTGTASFLLLDSAGNTLATGVVANGAKTTTFSGYQLAANTEYRLVMNDTGNFGTTYYYSTVATYQSQFGYALGGVSGAGAGTLDPTNIGGPLYIELDFEKKAYVSRANRLCDANFAVIDGYVSAPQTLGATVTLDGNTNSIITGVNSLVKGQSYYLQNAAGALAPTPGVLPMPAGVARSTTDLEITSFGMTERLIFNQTTPAVGGASHFEYTANICPVAEGRIRYTLIANSGGNSGMWLEWSESGNFSDTWVPVGIAGGGVTVTDQHIMVKKGFLRGRQLQTSNAWTATFTVYQ